MRQAMIDGLRSGRVIDMPELEPEAGRVLVKVLIAPLCTEYKAFAAGARGDTLGHEAAGEVLAAGGSARVREGQRVVVMPTSPCGNCALCWQGDYIHCLHGSGLADTPGNATIAQTLLKADWLLLPVPADIPLEHAAMACCGLGPTYGSMEQLGLRAGETILITGLGPVGLGGVINARWRGARVLGVEGNPYRAQLARELGAEQVFDPADDALGQILAATGGLGVERAMDCSGMVAAHRLCIDATRRLGAVGFVGECGDETPLVISRDMIRKGLTLVGTWHYNLFMAGRLMRQIREVGPQLEQLITHRFDIEDVQSAWELQCGGQSGKVLIQPWGAVY